MSFNPRDFIPVADRLAATEPPDEASFRAAIGRYYYAVLLSARNYLADSGPMDADRGEHTHRWVIDRLREMNEPVAQLLQQILTRMRQRRNQADYGDDLSRPAEAAQETCRDARTALRHLDTLIRRSRRKQ